MKKQSNALSCRLCFFVLILLQLVPSVVYAATDVSGELSVRLSQRSDNLNWNIAGSTVNVLSELKWENMSIAQFQVDGEINLINDHRVRANLGFGTVNSGTGQDSDYNGNNRTQEFSRSIGNAGGDVLDASMGFGKMLRLRELGKGNTFYVTPFVGFSLHRQNLRMTDGVQAIPASGPFPGLDSSYDAQWAGPWWGAEALIETERGWVIKGSLEYHLVEFSASANWNLRADFAHPVSFRHNAKGDGVVLSLGASYPLDKIWKMEITLEHYNWSTVAGTDLVYMADGSVGNARLNFVNWDSTAYMFGVVRKF